MFNMENKSNSIAWVGDIYQKFEAMCMEVDDMVCQETLKYVENQLHTVSANVQQFCSELMHEVLLSSPTKLVQNAGITTCEDLNITVDEDNSQKELIHPPSLESVNNEHFGLSSEQSKEDESALAHCSGSILSDPVVSVAINNPKELIHPSSFESVNYEQFGLSSEQSKEDESALAHCSGSIPSDPVISVVINNPKELIHSSSLESVNYEYVGLFSVQSKEDESASAHCSGSIASDPVNLVAINNHLPDIDSTLDDNSLVSTEEASHKSVSKVEPKAVPFPSFYKTKLEESCVIVERSELQSLSNEAGKRRSYKKKLCEAFYSKPRSWKQIIEQVAESSEQKGNGVGLSRETNKYESLDVGFSDSDWEII